jgi:hypothetical protein
VSTGAYHLPLCGLHDGKTGPLLPTAAAASSSAAAENWERRRRGRRLGEEGRVGRPHRSEPRARWCEGIRLGSQNKKEGRSDRGCRCRQVRNFVDLAQIFLLTTA